MLKSCHWTPPIIGTAEFYPCARCMGLLPIDDFADAKIRRGKNSWCRSCLRAGRFAYHDKHRAERNAKEVERYQPRPLLPKPCVTCGVTFTPQLRNQQRYCGPRCSPRNRWQDRPNLDPGVKRKILERDGWLCYLCEKPVDRKVKWPHPFSATVDHVIPWSVSHSNNPTNLRAAHWRCNVEKGDSLPGEEIWVPEAA